MRPCSTRVRRPPTAAATTGVPHAAASRATSPKDSERLGHEHDVGGPVVGGQQVVGHGGDHADLVGDAELGDQLVDPLDLRGALGAAGPADHHEPGVGPAERGEGPDRDVEALERLDAADEQEHRAVAEVEVVQRGAGAVAGRPAEKKAWSTPGGTSSMRRRSAP